jgi:calcium permeable stress-gated cation channel
LTPFISDTETLALLIDERDEILENLEVAETRYISSFRTSTPDPSIADFPLSAVEPEPEPEPPTVPKPDSGRPVISRPRPLNGTTKRVS